MNLNPVAAVIGGALKAVGGVLKAVYDFLPKVALLVLAGVLAWMLLGSLGRGADLNRKVVVLTGERDRAARSARLWQADALDARAKLEKAATLRGQEAAAAAIAASDAAASCAARVAEARRSTAAINALWNREPEFDANHCPVRRLVPPGRVPDAVQPPAARPR